MNILNKEKLKRQIQKSKEILSDGIFSKRVQGLDYQLKLLIHEKFFGYSFRIASQSDSIYHILFEYF